MDSDGYVEPVAIVGMACRLPGGVNNPDEFWELLMEGKSGYSDFPDTRIKVESWHHPEAVRPGSIVTKGGYFIQHNMNEFDHEFFGISAVEASLMDPSQKQLLEVVYESCESAGVTAKELAGSLTGVYIGNFGLDQALMSLKDSEFMSPYTSTGISGTILSNRINYVLDLKGPSFTVDTACSSSFYALHLACVGLRNGDCNAAIVGAANAIRSIEAQLFSTKLGALSPTSHCHTFDAAADGYARADGIGAVYVMRLSDALRQGRPIRAVIRGSAVGANGHGDGLTKPDAEGQANTIRAAYRNARLSHDFARTGYFECHGTGTPVGDPIETNSVGSVFSQYHPSDNPLLIGSVKSNMGHSEAAAGVTALIKMVLAIEHEMIPPTIGITTLNPNIKFDEWGLKVVQQPTRWPQNLPLRRASVNSFGYGGANAHVILEGFDSVQLELSGSHLHRPLLLNTPADESDSRSDSASTDRDEGVISWSSANSSDGASKDEKAASQPQVLLVVSAKNAKSLTRSIETTQEQLRTQSVLDVAHTLAHRSHFKHRAFAVVDSSKVGVEEDSPITFTNEEVVPNITLGFIFTGQGAQWPSMGRQLLVFPEFLESIRATDAAIAALPDPPSYTVEDTILADITPSEMDEPRVAQLMSIAVEVALVDLLTAWDVHPSMVCGHSAGEIAAGYAAGYLTRAEAVSVAYYRGRAVSDTPLAAGAMIAVGVGEEEAQKLIPIGTDVVVAAVNSPRSVTLSGDGAAVQAIKDYCDSNKIFNRLLATKGVAYHSKHMVPAAEAYSIPLHKMKRENSKPIIKAEYFSTVTGEKWTQDEIPMAYWRQNMERPVLFSPAVAAMRAAGMTHAVEIGPHSTLRSPILDIIKGAAAASAGERQLPFKYMAAMKRKEDAVTVVLTAAGQLIGQGVDVNLARVNGNRGQYIRGFPSYPWDHNVLVKEARADVEWRMRPFARHDLLGSLMPGAALSTRVWRNMISVNHVPWLADHKVGGKVIFPAAGFMAMAIEAMRQVRSGGNVIVLEDVHIGAAMMVEESVEVFLTLRKQALGDTAFSDAWWEFNISSVREGNLSTEHAKGRVSSVTNTQLTDAKVLASLDMKAAEPMAETTWYEQLAAGKGLTFGPGFRRLSSITIDRLSSSAAATLNLSASPELTGMAHESEYLLHPTVLDNCLQVTVLAAGNTRSNQAFVPVSVDRLVVAESRLGAEAARLESRSGFVGFKGLHGASQMLNSEDEVLASLEGLRFVSIPADTDIEPTDVAKRELFWRMSWDDDYEAITKENEDLYFPPEKYWPKQYDYPRSTRTYLAQMWIVQFSRKYPHLMNKEQPDNIENRYFLDWARWLLDLTSREHPAMFSMTLEEREAAIEAERTRSPDGIRLSWELYDHLHEIINGTRPVLEVATKDSVLGLFYETQLIYDKFERAVALMGFKWPNMRILEIGAGTGSATGFALRALTAGGTKRYSSYVYTDISTSFFNAAEEKFGAYEDIEYKVYDMEKAPEEQDIEPETFDLVVASCTVHVTANVVRALKSIRKLLKPGGRILLSEITAEHHDQTFTLGLFPGFYKGYDEGRTRHPFLTPEQWADAFPQAGFSRPELSVNDVPEDFFGFTVLTARALDAQEEAMIEARDKTITVVHLNEPLPISSHIEEVATEQGLSVVHRPLVAAGTADKDADWEGTKRVVVVAELEKLFWSKISEPEYNEFKKLVRTVESVIWVTQGGLMDGVRPEAALVNGFFQCLDLKPDLKSASIDFEVSTKQDKDMAREILRRENLLIMSKDKQFRQHQGRWLVPRLLPDEPLINDFARSEGTDNSTVEVPLKDLGPVKVSSTDAGRLSALVFEPDHTLEGPPPAGFVDIQVKAVGMNMVELSALTGGYDTDSLSSEYAGIVTAVAPDVKGLAVGDRVFAFFAGQFGNVARVPALAVQHMLDKHSFEEAATLPTAYCTAWYSLVTVANLQAGEKVLIQSATGGFGLAAITVARMLGAEVFATAGSDKKREMLHAKMGVPKDHIFDSRNPAAKLDLKSATKGHGFDIVLNTTSGDYLREVSWPLVAPFGRFVELKKVDIMDNASINLKKFAEGVTFVGVDMHYVCANRPGPSGERYGTLRSLMDTIGRLYMAGILRPLPLTSFPVSRISDAYSAFSRFEHIGKLILKYEDDDKLPYLPLPKGPDFDPNSAYLIIGGVSGIGAYLSRWMVEQGVRNMILMTRSPLGDEGRDNVAQLQSMGATVTHVQGSVDDTASVRKALTVSGLPVKGVVNSGLVLRNMEFDKLSCSEMHETWAPKVAGTWVLHNVTQEMGLKLDFFVMLSSLTSISHAATQASYSAANCFIDEFARFRHKKGLPCTSIGLGVIGDVGFMGRHQHNMMHLMRNGHYVTLGRELMNMFATALFRKNRKDAWMDEELVAVGTEPTKLRELLETSSVPVPLWERDARWGIIGVHAMRSSRGGAGAGGRGAGAAKGDVQDMVAERLSRLLWVPIEKLDMDNSLSSLGIDSMIASEFRHWMYQTFRTNVSMMELLAADMSIKKLSEKLKGE